MVTVQDVMQCRVGPVLHLFRGCAGVGAGGGRGRCGGVRRPWCGRRRPGRGGIRPAREFLGAGDAGVEQVALEHHPGAGGERDDDGGVFAALERWMVTA